MRWSLSFFLLLGQGCVCYSIPEAFSYPSTSFSLSLDSKTFSGQRQIRHAAHTGPASLKTALLKEKARKLKAINNNLDSSTSYAQLPLSIPEFVPHYFEQPIDHNRPSFGTFQQRYWVSTRHYRPGGPILLSGGGEVPGEYILHSLDTGIMNILANGTGGMAIVLEHRYYGKSLPFSNFTTDSLRFLNNYQAAADSANFMLNVKIAGILDGDNVSAANRPWIYYGGSYAGARAAHMRVLYPDIVAGAIGSSAVVHATISYWEYYDLIRNYTPIACRDAIENTIQTVDFLLDLSVFTRTWIKRLFGLEDLRDDADFGSVLSFPVGAWQGMNWDPAISWTGFDQFCDALTTPKPSLWGESDIKTLTIQELFAISRRDDGDDERRDLYLEADKSLLSQSLQVPSSLFSYAKYIKDTIVSLCPEDENTEECFGTTDPEQFLDASINATWRVWQFQVCTEWGYFMHAAPDGHPSLLSRKITLDYTSKVCRLAYPPGDYYSVPNLPNVTAVNALGDFDLAMDRIAFIDGEFDPWRPACPHSDYAQPRKDTLDRPFKLISKAVHVWDENGLANRSAEPEQIRKIHDEEVEFVQHWLKQWEERN